MTPLHPVRVYRAWMWTALNCPDRSLLRRYRWPLTIRLAWIWITRPRSNP